MKKLTVLTGAGISAESGLRTFREAGGLWEDYDIMEVASIDAWNRNPDLVRQFYNERRRQLFNVQPNLAHHILAELEADFNIQVITQNVDDLHERAGSRNVLHLHGELRKVRSSLYPELVYAWENDLHHTDLCERGAPLRPHIVWFGEPVPMIEDAVEIILDTDILLIIGTSLQVYPAAGLIDFFTGNDPIFYIDPGDHPIVRRPLRHIRKTASEGLSIIKTELLELYK